MIAHGTGNWVGLQLGALLLHVGFHGLLGLPSKMVTGFQKQPSRESLVEVTLPWQSHSATSIVVGLSLPIFKEWRHRPHTSMKRMSKSCCRKNVWDGRQYCGCFWKTQSVTSYTCIVICFEWEAWCWLSVSLGKCHENCLSLHHLWECILHTIPSALCHEYLSSKRKLQTALLKDQLLKGAGRGKASRRLCSPQIPVELK